ncbi:MAG: ABC transporter permease [Bacteroidetes bacterium]|nr:ABC transporter permease [Bacteroidota bacterium]
MLRFILRKLGFACLILWGVATLVFFLFMALPSAEEMLVGQRSDVKTKEAIVRELGLNEPLYKRYAYFLNDLAPLSIYSDTEKASQIPGWRLKLGEHTLLMLKKPWLRSSYQSKKPVAEMLMDAFPGTLLLAGAALLFAAIVGIGLGILAALKAGKTTDHLISGISALGISAPSFFAAMLIAWLFGYVWHDWTGLSMTGSMYDVDPLGRGRVRALHNLILPCIALGIRPLSVFVQLTRNNILEQMALPYVRTARAKGLSEGRILFTHVLRNALNPVLTAVTGWFASLLAGAFFTEYIFNWKGIGKLTIDALQQSDLPLVMGAVLLSALLFVIISFFTDILYKILDPRVSGV